MSYTALQNTPIVVDLLVAAKDTGWSFNGAIAHHESCNAGRLTLTSIALTPGVQYVISYQILNISGGYLQLTWGGVNGAAQTTTGLKVETVTASNGASYFFSNATADVQIFNYQPILPPVSNKVKTTVAYSALLDRWTSFYTFAPDVAVSLFINTYSFYNGDFFNHQNGTNNRNNFYGTQYNTILKLVENGNPTIVKTFEKLSYQANTLLVTTTDGITTSLGQVSNLLNTDFIQYVLDDGITQINVYQEDGLYTTTFLRNDMGETADIINGDMLKGNYLTIELTLDDNTQILQLFTVDIKSAKSFNQIR